MSTLQNYLGWAGTIIETIGVLVIIIGFIVSTAWYVTRLRSGTSLDSYRRYRQDLGHSIMLGLEFLIAGDIIRTIVIEQTLDSAATLAVIVAIRIILSLTLEYEVEGRTPWQRDKP
ncbi:MAG TPA: DUF1622 domain-containing protein [Aestuariivirgaceae bacterium]|nr:DUF1622 domain-containing protein [Aestuariivirgaceae bacterium]